MSTRLLAVIPFFLFYFRRVGGGSLVSFFPCVCVATEERQGKWGSRCRERATRAELNLCSILNRYHQMYHSSSPPVRPLRVVCGCENRNSRRHQLFAAIYVSLFPSRPSAHQSIPIYIRSMVIWKITHGGICSPSICLMLCFGAFILTCIWLIFLSCPGTARFSLVRRRGERQGITP